MFIGSVGATEAGDQTMQDENPTIKNANTKQDFTITTDNNVVCTDGAMEARISKKNVVCRKESMDVDGFTTPKRSRRPCSAGMVGARPGGVSNWRGVPPGLGFKVLQEDEEDDEEACEEMEVMAVEGIEHKECSSIRSISDTSDNPKSGSTKRKNWMDLGIGEIIVDSAADESCWPQGQGDAFPTKPSRRKLILKTAIGGDMKHYGKKEVRFKTAEGDILGLTFQVTDVRKPLLAVRRLVEKGSLVSFGPELKDCYIMNKVTGTKVMMEKRGGSFVIRAHFVADIEPGFTRQV